MADLKNNIRSVKNTSGITTDGMTLKILNHAIEVVGNRFLDIINSSLDNGVFLSEWKCTVVVPIKKNYDKNDFEKCRPMNMTPVYEKLSEVAMKKQLCERL